MMENGGQAEVVMHGQQRQRGGVHQHRPVDDREQLSRVGQDFVGRVRTLVDQARALIGEPTLFGHRQTLTPVKERICHRLADRAVNGLEVTIEHQVDEFVALGPRS
ncbi:hypothetical protein ACWCXB_24205 [Streptomyces sp. NPDC001514]